MKGSESRFADFFFCDILKCECELLEYESDDIVYKIHIKNLIQCISRIDNNLFERILDSDDGITSNPWGLELLPLCNYDQAIIIFVTNRILFGSKWL
ncbi:hypothetical protein A8L34_27900 [Bacillus sp. FJAT-27264]|nr:hypothetical protein A8L34_27900 [Bacillus sp. FJAT-27264]